MSGSAPGNGNGNGATTLPLDPAEIARTLVPVERATMLPPAAFTDQAVLDWEVDEIFSGWVCMGHVSAVADQGDYLVREIGRTSVFASRGSDGEVRAFLNTCRHRGARIFTETEGSVRKRIQCPYHAWSYDLEGKLVAAPHMNEVEDFDRSCWGLLRVRSAIVAGLVLIDLSGEAPDPVEHVGHIGEFLERYRVPELERASATVYDVKANWKGIAENYNECLHCPGVHPELNALSDYRSGEEVYGEGDWCGGSMALNEDAGTMAIREGHPSRRPPIEGLTDKDINSVYYFALFPNALISLHPDYFMLHTLWPKGPGETEVTCEWLFEPSTIAMEGFDPSDAVEFWDMVNKQDWYVCELTQLGVGARGYTPGRYAGDESDTHAFDLMVAGKYMEALQAKVGSEA